MLVQWDQQETRTYHGNSTVSIEELIEARKKRPFVASPENWGWLEVWGNHLKNIGSNEESLWSKFYRKFTLPSAQLLQQVRKGMQNVTLVVDINAIAYSSWSRKQSGTSSTGFVRKIRPGWKELLTTLAMEHRWEVVLWSGEEMMDWESSLELLDPLGGACRMLWGKDCYYYNSTRCKNIARLNRPLENVVVLETNPMHVQLQPQNAVLIDPYDGSDGDTALEDYGEFLLYLASSGAEDVRSVLAKYRGKDGGFLAAWSEDMEEMYGYAEPQYTAASYGRSFRR